VSDLRRDLFRALGRGPLSPAPGARLALCALYTFVPSAEAQRAREDGLRVSVVVPQRVVADLCGFEERSVRRHIKALVAAGAVVPGEKIGNVRELLLASTVDHLRGRTDGSGEDDQSDRPDRGGMGPRRPEMRTEPSPVPTVRAVRPVMVKRTEPSELQDSHALHKPLVAPERAPTHSGSSRSPYGDRVRAVRPVPDAPDRPTGLDAHAILTRLAEHRHPEGIAPIRAYAGRDLERLLAGDGEHGGAPGREVLDTAIAYLRILRERVPVPQRRGPAKPEDPRWWGAGMFKPERWAVIEQVVARVQAIEAQQAAPAPKDPALARLEAMERETAGGRRVSAEELHAGLRRLRGGDDDDAA
jgi:hypothetical protein